MKYKKIELILLYIFLAFGCIFAEAPAKGEGPVNILFIMADDLGYSDIGSYGGEISTPHLDKLARGGIRFSHFRGTPMCATSRVAINSGMSFVENGMYSYEGSIPLAEVLSQAGFQTFLTGKWHAGPHPVSEGFYDRFFGFLGGMTDQYAGSNDWYLDSQPFTDFDSDFDSTVAITNGSIEFMKEAIEMQKPFFGMVCYNAPHHPLQARRETYEKYLSIYEKGFGAIREERHLRQIKTGLVSPEWASAEADSSVRDWCRMASGFRRIEVKRMAAYAAMVDEMDAAIGKLLAFLDEVQIAEDTIVIFTSDNGGYFNNGSFWLHDQQKPWLAHHNQTISNGWGWVQNTPFRHFKQSCFEGGLSVPFILRWPSQFDQRAGEISRIEADFTDLYPFLLELAGATRPDTFKNEPVKPLTGKSFLKAIRNEECFEPPARFHWFYHSRAWIENGYKVVSIYNGPWMLFDLAKDRTEQTDLASIKPELAKSLSEKWMKRAFQIGMTPDLCMPAQETQLGWGWHRLRVFSSHLQELIPANGAVIEPYSTELVMKFDAEIDFSKSENKKIQLYATNDDRSPVWEIDLAADHPSQGYHELRLTGIPPLQPGTDYFVLIDNGAFMVGGKPVGIINDGAYWWRFRTK